MNSKTSIISIFTLFVGLFYVTKSLANPCINLKDCLERRAVLQSLWLQNNRNFTASFNENLQRLRDINNKIQEFRPEYTFTEPIMYQSSDNPKSSYCLNTTKVSPENICQMTQVAAEEFCLKYHGGLPSIRQLVTKFLPYTYIMSQHDRRGGYEPIYLENGEIDFYFETPAGVHCPSYSNSNIEDGCYSLWSSSRHPDKVPGWPWKYENEAYYLWWKTGSIGHSNINDIPFSELQPHGVRCLE